MWCHSACDLVKFDFEWTIQNFAIQEFSNIFLINPPTSSEMSALELPELKWSFQLFQRIQGLNKIIHINLLCNNGATRVIPFRVKCYIVNNKREKIIKGEHPLIVEIGKSGQLSKIVDLHVSQIRSENLLSDEGHLSIFCEIETVSATKTSSGQSRNDEAKLLNSDEFDAHVSLVNNYQTLLEKKIMTDVTLKTGGKEFQAHKAILAVRSPVFAVMFQQEMQEKVSNQVHVLDIQSDVFQEILHFIYTNQISLTKMEELAAEILSAADKYFLEDLKNQCETYLKSQMSTENCIELLTLADRHSANNLKQDAVKFFRNIPAQVIASDGWKKAQENDPAWLCKIMKSLLIDF